MNPNRVIRRGGPEDYDAMAEVVFDAVRKGRSLYSQEQREAWMPVVPRHPDWEMRLSPQTIVVAENSGEMMGFMSLAQAGYIDFAYIRPSAQGTGLFRQLYREVQDIAWQSQEPRLWTHASLMAQPAFSKVGFDIICEQTVEIRGQLLKRFEMEKILTSPNVCY